MAALAAGSFCESAADSDMSLVQEGLFGRVLCCLGLNRVYEV
jgi:hypothetical protein